MKVAKREGNVFFLTLFLQDCLPQPMIERMEQDFRIGQGHIPTDVYDSATLIDLHKRRYFKKIDDLLHALSSEKDLFGNDTVCESLAEFLLNYSSPTFNIIAYSFMFNHIHICLSTTLPNIGTCMDGFLEASKVFFSTNEETKANAWHEAANMIPVVDRKALSKMMHFIVNEPVERELEEETFDWKWTFVNEKYEKLLDYKTK